MYNSDSEITNQLIIGAQFRMQLVKNILYLNQTWLYFGKNHEREDSILQDWIRMQTIRSVGN